MAHRTRYLLCVFAAVLFSLGCSSRKSLSPELAIQGHWKVGSHYEIQYEAERTSVAPDFPEIDVFVGKDTLRFVDSDGTVRGPFEYEIIPLGETMKLKMRVRTPTPHDEMFIFNTDKSKLSNEDIRLNFGPRMQTVITKTTWTYLGSN